MLFTVLVVCCLSTTEDITAVHSHKHIHTRTTSVNIPSVNDFTFSYLGFCTRNSFTFACLAVFIIKLYQNTPNAKKNDAVSAKMNLFCRAIDRI